MNQKYWNILIFSLFLITTILVIVCVYQIKLQKESCIQDPLIYGARKLSEANNAEFSCTCYLAVEISPIITFNQYGMNVEHISVETRGYETNFSKIKDMFAEIE